MTSASTRVLPVAALVLGALAVQSPAFAGTFGGAMPVSNQQLNQIRGGFSWHYDVGQFGFALDWSQINTINGNPVPAQHTTSANGGTLSVIQSGPNNVVIPSVANGLTAGSAATVIQNSLDNQVVNTLRVLNITLTSHALAQAMAAHAMMENALLQFSH